MRRPLFVIGIAGIVVGTLGVVRAHVAPKDLPEGPIRDRHELMEGIGKNAKTINDAMKSGNLSPVGGAAEKIQAKATRITGLFPAGSTHPNSRAKPEIWTNWAKFESNAKDLETKAGALATAAKSGGDVGAGVKGMFGVCKSCHDEFRVPEKDEKS